MYRLLKFRTVLKEFRQRFICVAIIDCRFNNPCFKLDCSQSLTQNSKKRNNWYQKQDKLQYRRIELLEIVERDGGTKKKLTDYAYKKKRKCKDIPEKNSAVSSRKSADARFN